jgi:hypothetical protein
MMLETFFVFQNFANILFCIVWMQHVGPASKASAPKNSIGQLQGGEQPPECKQQ